MFSTRIKVRTYELDPLGHVNQAVYHSYAEVARVEMLAASGCRLEQLAAEAKSPVLLESHIVYRRELRGTDEIDVTSEAKFGAGKVFQIDSKILKADGTLSAEINCTQCRTPRRHDDLTVRETADAGRVEDGDVEVERAPLRVGAIDGAREEQTKQRSGGCDRPKRDGPPAVAGGP